MIGIQSWCGVKPVKYVNLNADKVGAQVLLTNWPWVPGGCSTIATLTQYTCRSLVVGQQNNLHSSVASRQQVPSTTGNTVMHIPGTRPSSRKAGIVIFALFS